MAASLAIALAATAAVLVIRREEPPAVRSADRVYVIAIEPGGREAVVREASQTLRLVFDTGGYCLGQARPRVVEARAVETRSRITLIVRYRPAPKEDDPCAGLGSSESVDVDLAAPVGDRPIVARAGEVDVDRP